MEYSEIPIVTKRQNLIYLQNDESRVRCKFYAHPVRLYTNGVIASRGLPDSSDSLEPVKRDDTDFVTLLANVDVF